jgi:dihydropteroate synthase
LARRASELEAVGIDHDAIVLDPGFGFAKAPAHNLELLRRLNEIVDLGYPVLAGTSRKSFIGDVLDAPVDRRVGGTAATVAWVIAKGARIVRVHDVAAMIDVVRMTEAIAQAPDPSAN